MSSLIESLKRLFGMGEVTTIKETTVSWPPELIRDLLAQTAVTEPDDYSCDECDRLMAHFAEEMAAGQPAAELMPRVQKHLDTCPSCREECEALLRILEVTAEG